MNCTISRASVEQDCGRLGRRGARRRDWPDQDAATILLAAEAWMPRLSKTGAMHAK